MSWSKQFSYKLIFVLIIMQRVLQNFILEFLRIAKKPKNLEASTVSYFSLL